MNRLVSNCVNLVLAGLICLCAVQASQSETVTDVRGVHVGKGLWWDFFALNDMVAELGGLQGSSYFSSKHKSLLGFPGSPIALAEQDLIILANVGAAAVPPKNHAMLKEFVKNGGALFILGGRLSLDSGGFAESELAELLPCILNGKGRVKAGEPLVMQAGPDAKGVLPGDLAWDMAPRAYYYHKIEAKPGAKVLVKAGDRPLLVMGSFGSGLVAVFAVSVEGDPPADELAFWEWPDLFRLMASVGRGLMGPAGSVRNRTVQDSVLEEIGRKIQDRSVPDGTGEAGRDKALSALAPECRSPDLAYALLGAVSTFQTSPSRGLVSAAAEAVRPFAAGAPMGVVEAMIASGDPGKVELGLRVLGMARAKGAGERLSRVAGQGLSGLSDSLSLSDTGASLVDSASIMTVGGMDERVRLGAIIALGDLGDKAYIRALTGATRDFAGKRQLPPDISETSAANESAYQEALMARVKLGDKSAVRPLFETVIRNEESAEEYKNALDHLMRGLYPDVTRDRLINHSGAALPVYAERQDAIRRMLVSVSCEMAPEIAGFLAERNDLRLSSFAIAALHPYPWRTPDRKTAEALMPLVEKGRRPDQRLLAFRIISDLRDPGLTQQLESVIAGLASSDESANVRFALSRVTELSHSARKQVLAAASAHSDEEIRRLAKLFAEED